MSGRPLEDRPDLVNYQQDGEPTLTFKALSYLLGVDESELQAAYDQQGGPERFNVPAEWMQRGRANCARMGTKNMAEALFLLAREREAGLN